MSRIIPERIDYSPGYSDMLGGHHNMTLKKNENGEWVCICRDREDHSAPTVAATHEVSAGDVEQFFAFLAKKRVYSLEKRLQSTMFITDYSPWHFSIDYKKRLFGKTAERSCYLKQYRIYTPHDRKILKELFERFTALCGNKISETSEED